MKKILVIFGPTSTGKTDLALNLAGKFNGEIISCDSRQVYTGLDIGTGKMPSTGRWKIEDGRWIVEGIPIHMYDVMSPKKQYNVADYVKDANKVISGIEKRGKLPIIVGGTGFYLKALLEGLPNLSIPVDKNLRKKLQKLSKEDLQEKLKKLSPERWNSLNESDRENPRRLVRAIELALTKANAKRFKIYDLRLTNFDILKIGLIAPREVLYKRVDERVIERINQGMIEETKRLYKNGLSLKRMRQLGLEYGVLADFLEGNINEKKELIRILQNKIHGYVRKQLTWFKKDKNVNWFDITTSDYQGKIEKVVSKWYYQPNATKN